MSASRPSGRLTILDLVLLIGGASVGLWIFIGIVRERPMPARGRAPTGRRAADLPARRALDRRPADPALAAPEGRETARARRAPLVLPGDRVLAALAADRLPADAGEAGQRLDGGDLLLLRHAR